MLLIFIVYFWKNNVDFFKKKTNLFLTVLSHFICYPPQVFKKLNSWHMTKIYWQ